MLAGKKKYDYSGRIVLVQCGDCGCGYSIAYNTWVHNPRDKHWRCPDCMKIWRAENLRLRREQDPELVKRTRAGASAYWKTLTDDEKRARNAKSIAANKNRTDEEKLEWREKLSFSHKALWENDYCGTRRKNASKKMRDWWKALSPEEYRHRQYIGKMTWDKLSQEQKIIRSEKTRKRFERMSDEDKKIWVEKIRASWRNKPLNERMIPGQREKHKWASYDHEEYLKHSNILRENWNKIPVDKQLEYRKKSLSTSNKNNSLNRRFESYFQESYINNSHYYEEEFMVSNSDIVHSWDYGIFDENGDLQMLVDLDGAFYHADIIDYNGYHSKEEYDEKRFLSVPDGVKYHIIYEKQFTKSFEEMIKKLMINYDQFVEDQFRYCRLLPDIPYPSYSDRELLKSYEQLRKLKTDDKYHQSISLNNREGDRLINQFHHSIYYAKRKGSKKSPYEAWYDDDLLRKIIKNRIIYINKINPNKILQGFNIAKVAQKVSVFSAGRAKLIISKYLNEFDTIFDPFSGFSGRMLGTIASGKKYIGQDISEIHLRESVNIVEFLKRYGIDCDVELHQKDIKQSHGNYPCLFTCPPYSDKEQWLDVPIDMRTCDDWIDLCLNHFKCQRYVFVVDTTEKYKDHIVDTITNRSHMNKNNEYVISI